MKYKRKYQRDLFGNREPIEPIKRKRKPVSKVTVEFRLEWEEYQKLIAISNKFKMPMARYCRDAVKQSISGHECIMSAEHNWPKMK